MEDKWAEHVARVGELKIAYRVLVGQTERKGVIGRHRRKFVAFLECHAALIDSYVRTFRDNLFAPFSQVKQSKKNIQWGNIIIINHAETE